MIDFGLSFVSTASEERAVDLYVLERSFVSTHPLSEQLVNVLLQSYFSSSCRSEETLQRLEAVRMRGRKRDMFG